MPYALLKPVSLTVFLLLLSTSIATANHTESVETMANKVGDHQLTYLLQIPKADPPEQGYPVMLFLHGYGECGTDIEKVKVHGPPKRNAEFQQLKGCIIVSPQCPQNSWWRVNTLKALMDEVLSNHESIDQRRMYITGLSMGGYGTWSFLSHYPNYFTAALPICGGGDPLRLPKNNPPHKSGIKNEFRPKQFTKAAHLPIWTFHGTEDGAVPISETELLVAALRKAEAKELKYTVYKDVGHIGAWQRAYTNKEVWSWLFSQSKNN
tara:strand:- start:8027 stop:8821 length:795 start_codon:yes stop_codon:yes gene_type:complete